MGYRGIPAGVAAIRVWGRIGMNQWTHLRHVESYLAVGPDVKRMIAKSPQETIRLNVAAGLRVLVITYIT